MNNITIIPLGTVSPYPKKEMNCPGFLVLYNDKKILLDCGNGISSLLNFPDCLNNLYVIITHYHKDHFGDIGAIQYASYVYHNLNCLDEKVKIYLPKKEFASNRKSILENSETYSQYFDITDKFSFYIDDLKITFEDNNSHTIETFMVKLENVNHKVVYTSDVGTSNFESLIDFCKNSDLLICESSFLTKHNTNSTTHMTSQKAAILAESSNSKKLLLTHLWPEEDKNLYLEEAISIHHNTDIAIEGKKLVLGEK